MKNILNVILLCLGFLPLRSMAQTTPDSTTARAECIDTDYQFFILGESYSSGSKIFICSNSLPLTINVVKEGEVPLGNSEAENVVWTNANGGSGDMVEAVLGEGNFSGDMVEVLVDFMVNGVGHALEITVDQTAELEIKKEETTFAVDDHKLYDNSLKTTRNTEIYSTYKNSDPFGVTWYFLEQSKSFSLKFKVNPNKKSTKTEVQVAPDTHITLDPAILSKGNSSVKFTSIGTEKQEVSLLGCDNKDLAKVYIAPPKVIDIRIVAVCETDDDILMVPEVPWKVESSDFICINPGPDGTIDEYQKNKGTANEGKMDGDDVVKIEGGKVYVLAGPNKECETRVRGKKKSSKPTKQCPDKKSELSILKDLNDIYAKVGIQFTASLGMQTVDFNYEIYAEDGFFSEKEYVTAQLFLQKVIPVIIPQRDPVLVIVKDAWRKPNQEQQSGGFAQIGGNIAVVDTDSGLKAGIMAHELGHALFKLEHPKVYGELEDLENVMYRSTGFYDEDTGELKPSGNNFRAFQWKEINND